MTERGGTTDSKGGEQWQSVIGTPDNSPYSGQVGYSLNGFYGGWARQGNYPAYS